MEVVDSVNDYLELMKEIFDFEVIGNLIRGTGQAPLKVLINSMHGGKTIFNYHPLQIHDLNPNFLMSLQSPALMLAEFFVMNLGLALIMSRMLYPYKILEVIIPTRISRTLPIW